MQIIDVQTEVFQESEDPELFGWCWHLVCEHHDVDALEFGFKTKKEAEEKLLEMILVISNVGMIKFKKYAYYFIEFTHRPNLIPTTIH